MRLRRLLWLLWLLRLCGLGVLDLELLEPVLDLALGGVEDFEGLLQVGRLRRLLVEQLVDAHHLLVDGLQIFLLGLVAGVVLQQSLDLSEHGGHGPDVVLHELDLVPVGPLQFALVLKLLLLEVLLLLLLLVLLLLQLLLVLLLLLLLELLLLELLLLLLLLLNLLHLLLLLQLLLL